MRWIEASSAIICFRFVDRRSAGRHQVDFHPRKRLKELFAIRIEEAAKSLSVRRFAKPLCGEKQRAAGPFQEQLPGAPIGSVLPTLDQAALRESIEDAHESNRPDLKQFAKGHVRQGGGDFGAVGSSRDQAAIVARATMGSSPSVIMVSWVM
jgi:hypothetical protein